MERRLDLSAAAKSQEVDTTTTTQILYKLFQVQVFMIRVWFCNNTNLVHDWLLRLSWIQGSRYYMIMVWEFYKLRSRYPLG